MKILLQSWMILLTLFIGATASAAPVVLLTEREAAIPSGRHKIRVTITDDKGGFTQETFVMKVP